MTPRFGLIASLCIIACGKDPAGDGGSESTSTSTGGEESSTSSTTMVMTTTPPTTTMTTAVDSSESSTGEAPCSDPFTQGELERYPLFQLEEGAETVFTDIGVIIGDRYMAGSVAPAAGEPRLAMLLIINPGGIEEALTGEGTMDVAVDRLAVDPSGNSSKMITQINGDTVEVRDPGDFFNVVGTYQEMGARTRLYDVTTVDGALWGVGYAAGMTSNRGLVAQSTDMGATWMMTSTFELDAGQAAEGRAVAYHAGADALVIAGTAADTDLVLNWHVRTGLIAQPADTEVLESIPEGNARAVEVIGDDIYVAGDVGGLWRIRSAPSVGAPFEDFDDGGGLTGDKSTIVDLAQGPNGELFALGTTDDEVGQTLMVVRMCADPSLGAACWTTLVEPDQMFVGESTFPTRLLIDEEGVWITGSVIDMDEKIGNEGALFRLGCPV